MMLQEWCRYRCLDKALMGIVLLSIVVYAIQTLAWPLAPGRDFSSYVTYFVQILMDDPGYPRTMLHRTFFFPVLLGGLNALGGTVLIELFAGFLFVTSVVAVYYIGLRFNKMSGIAAALLVILFPSYGALYHFISSEFLTSCTFLYWIVYLLYSKQEFSVKTFFIHGLFVALLVYIRPANQVLVLFMFYPLLKSNFSYMQKMKASASFLFVVFVAIFMLSSYNFYRYNHFGVSGGSGGFPFYKVYTKSGLVKPENGVVSSEMAELIKSKLLDKDPYKMKSMDIEGFFDNSSGRKWFDMLILSENNSFSSSNPLRAMAFEAILQAPFVYIKQCVRDIVMLFSFDHKQYKPEPPVVGDIENSFVQPTELLERMESRLTSYKGNDIAISYFELEMYRDQESLANIAHLLREVDQLNLVVPSRDGDVFISRILNQITSVFPGMFWFLVVGGVGFLMDKQRKMFPLFFMVFLAFFLTSFAVCGVNDVPHYRLMFDPVFIVFGVVGVVRANRW